MPSARRTNNVISETLKVIRKERMRRIASVRAEDPRVADYRWEQDEEPLLNDLCLMVLVTIRHHMERELLKVAASLPLDNERTLRSAEYQSRLEKERKSLRERDGWNRLLTKLGIDGKEPEFEILRLLVNDYKHDPLQLPSNTLLARLSLDPTRNYHSVAQSAAVRKALSRHLGLSADADLCAVADAFSKRVDRFLERVRCQHPDLCGVRPRGGGARPSRWLQ